MGSGVSGHDGWPAVPLTVKVRPAVPTDAKDVAAIHVRSWQAAYPGLIPQDYLDDLDPADRLPAWQAIFSATDWPSAGTLLLVDAGETVGFCHLSPSRDADTDPRTTGEVQSIYLAPEAWGRGGGALLLGAAVDRLAEAGFSSAVLWVLRENDRARRFYDHLGWGPDGTSKLHHWGSFDATDLRYRRYLPPEPGP